MAYSGQSFSHGASESKAGVEDEYFESYGNDFEVHRVMLEDGPRMKFYRTFLMNPDNVKGKVVVEVGAGTGVLSCWAAKGGASKVVSIEASEFAQTVLGGVIADNNLGGVVSVVPKRAEAFQTAEELWAAAGLSDLFNSDSSSIKGVVLISEWMGFYLLHEGMLNSVLYARDLLKKSFTNESKDYLTMYPSHADISVAPITLAPLVEEKFMKFWKKATPNSEINLEAVGRAEAAQYFSQVPNPMIEVLPGDCLLSDPKVVWTFSLMETTDEDLRELQARPSFPFNRVTSGSGQKLDGFCVWFTTSGGGPSDVTPQPLVLDTSPLADPTHWKQSTILLPAELREDGGIPADDLINPNYQASDPACGEQKDKMGIVISLNQEESGLGSRCYDIDLSLFDPEDDEE